MEQAQALARLDALIPEMDELEDKRGKAEGDKAKFYAEELEAKKKEYDDLVAKVEAMEESKQRKAKLAKLKEKPEVESKKGDLQETDVRVPDSKHNETVYQAKKDQLSRDYMTAKRGEFDKVLAKADGRLVEGISGERGGFKLPSYVEDYLVFGEKALSVMQGKSGTNDLLVANASGTASGGGSLVPTTFVPELYKYPMIEAGLLSRCFVKRAVGKDCDFPRLDQGTDDYSVSITWDTEGSAASESDPVFNVLTVDCDRMALLTYASDKMMRNEQIGLEAELAWMFRGAFTRQMDIHIIRGTRTNFYGIASYLGYTAGVNRVSRETASAVSYVDLVSLEHATNEGNRQNSIYIMSGDSTGAARYIKALDDATYGKPVAFGPPMGGWNPSERRPYGMTVNGYECIEARANNNAVGARGDVIFGDLGSYAVAIDLDLTIARSDEYLFNQAVSTFRLLAYVGGEPLGPDAFAVLDDVSGVSSSSSSSSTKSASEPG